MPEFAQRVRALGARPGIWVRPLQAYPGQPQSWRLARDRHCLNPSVSEVRAYVCETIRRLQGWGFELIKHDYSTEEIAGRWGFEMKGEMIADGWAFADRSRTTAEVILNLYRDIRQAAGKDTLVLGCNTVGHLAAGLFELQRIGDNTSGKDWSRTRKMGVNSLAFRAPQHGTFFAVDGDCAGQAETNAVLWEKNRQWLELLARSGTPLFVSFPARDGSRGAGGGVKGRAGRCLPETAPRRAIGLAGATHSLALASGGAGEGFFLVENPADGVFDETACLEQTAGHEKGPKNHEVPDYRFSEPQAWRWRLSCEMRTMIAAILAMLVPAGVFGASPPGAFVRVALLSPPEVAWRMHIRVRA